MPDHLHLLVAGNDRSSLLRFTQHFKQLSGYAYKKAIGEPLWQISYWDRVLRSDEDLAVVARYIWGNPVRAGLAEDARLYQFSGAQPLPEVW
jgi:putative transposase